MLDNIPPAVDGQTPDLRIILTKRQILDGARQIFLQNGYAGAKIEEIAAKGGSRRARSTTTSTARMTCSSR
jgi:hypothetical protein